MYRLEREEYLRPQYVPLWSMLGFQAGFINAFGFLACGRYVSHVTGFGTQIGVALAEQRVWFAIELLGFPVSFALGAFTSGIFTSARLENGLRPNYDLITMTLPVIIGLLGYFGMKGYFGPFGELLTHPRDFALLYLLSLVCGMQNGCFATLTKGQVRTTHLTGISTDIGTDAARLWFGNLGDRERELTSKTNFSRISTFCFFALGSVASVWVSAKFEYQALLVPFATAVGAYIWVWHVGQEMDRLVRAAVPVRIGARSLKL